MNDASCGADNSKTYPLATAPIIDTFRYRIVVSRYSSEDDIEPVSQNKVSPPQKKYQGMDYSIAKVSRGIVVCETKYPANPHANKVSPANRF